MLPLTIALNPLLALPAAVVAGSSIIADGLVRGHAFRGSSKVDREIPIHVNLLIIL